MSDRKQDYCQECESYTLFERDPPTVDHKFHLLMTVFCCGCWWPLWLLLALSAPARRFRCMECGLEAGKPSFREQEQNAELLAEKRRLQAEAAARMARSAAGATGKMMAGGATAGLSGARLVALKVWEMIRLSLEQVDGVLQKLCGGDQFMLWMYRILLCGAIGFAGSLALYALGKATGRI